MLGVVHQEYVVLFLSFGYRYVTLITTQGCLWSNEHLAFAFAFTVTTANKIS